MKKKSHNFACSGVIHVLTTESVALIYNKIAKNCESRPIIALVEIITIIIMPDALLQQSHARCGSQENR